jgi:hypothetical protein
VAPEVVLADGMALQAWCPRCYETFLLSLEDNERIRAWADRTALTVVRLDAPEGLVLNALHTASASGGGGSKASP